MCDQRNFAQLLPAWILRSGQKVPRVEDTPTEAHPWTIRVGLVFSPSSRSLGPSDTFVYDAYTSHSKRSHCLDRPRIPDGMHKVSCSRIIAATGGEEVRPEMSCDEGLRICPYADHPVMKPLASQVLSSRTAVISMSALLCRIAHHHA